MERDGILNTITVIHLNTFVQLKTFVQLNMLIERKEKHNDARRIAEHCADTCCRLRRSNQSGDRILRRCPLLKVHISQNTMLRVPKDSAGALEPRKTVESRKIPKLKENEKK